MDFQFRNLNSEDLLEISRINSAHKKIMGLWKKSEYDEDFLNNIETYFNNPDRYILGAFHGDRLASYVGIIHWPIYPFWTFTSAKADPHFSEKVFQPQLNGITGLISKTIQVEEMNSRFAYWFVTSRKQNNGYKGHLRNFIPELEHFTFISRTIEKNYKPKNEFIWKLIGSQVWEEDLVIRVGVRTDKLALLGPYLEFLQVNSEYANQSDDARVLRC